MGTMWIVGKQWITSVNRTKCMIKLVLIHFKLRLSFLGWAVLEMKVLFCDNWWLWFQFCCVAGWAILEEFMQSCFYIKQSLFSMISAQNRNSVCPSGGSGGALWGHSVVTLCSIKWGWIQVLIRKQQDVNTSGTSNPLWVSGSPPGGASWIFRERGTGSSEATPGALSHPKCLWELPGPSCPNSMENHLEALVTVRQIVQGSQGRSAELPLNSCPWLCPWSCGWQDQEEERGLVSPWCPWFGDIQGCWGVIPILPVSPQWGYWPSWWNSAGAWNVIIAALWEVEWEISIPWPSECFANSNIWAVCLNWMKVLH